MDQVQKRLPIAEYGGLLSLSWRAMSEFPFDDLTPAEGAADCLRNHPTNRRPRASSARASLKNRPASARERGRPS